MIYNKNIFVDKKILIYGLGKSGTSSFNFLKNDNKIYLFDDKKKFLSKNRILKIKYDFIIISPGIDVNKCKLKNFLKKNSKKIYTDLDIFRSRYKNKCVTITGTNGKSTTCQLIYEIFKKQGYDVKLAGNIGYPILSIKNIKPKSIFVIEASSYQLDYSKIFNSKYSAVLNISPDHLERHKTLGNYIKAKFNLLKNQKSNSVTFVKKNDDNIRKFLKKTSFKGNIIKVNTNSKKNLSLKFKNNYFLSRSNKENLLFVLQIINKFKINKKILFKTIKNFKGLKYRQQTIFNKKNLKIINDSKSTSYASSIEMLKSHENIYWLLGGIPKKGDKFYLPNMYLKNITAYIFGRNSRKFIFDLKNKIKLKKFKDLTKAIDSLSRDIKTDKSNIRTILFSPAAASFDSFKNFEERGSFFNKMIKKKFNVK